MILKHLYYYFDDPYDVTYDLIKIKIVKFHFFLNHKKYIYEPILYIVYIGWYDDSTIF